MHYIIKAILLFLALFPGVIRQSCYNMPLNARKCLPDAAKCFVCEITLNELELFSAVVEAESDRGEDTASYEGRVLIALTILNRVNSSQWPDSIEGVIKQQNQYEAYYNGSYLSAGRSQLADAAIIEACQMLEDGSAPNVIYFNCIGYNYLGVPYCYKGGNYFELGE